MPDRDRQPAVDPPGAVPGAGSAPALPQLSADQVNRITAYGVSQAVAMGDILFGPGDVDYDVILIESG